MDTTIDILRDRVNSDLALLGARESEVLPPEPPPVEDFLGLPIGLDQLPKPKAQGDKKDKKQLAGLDQWRCRPGTLAGDLNQAVANAARENPEGFSREQVRLALAALGSPRINEGEIKKRLTPHLNGYLVKQLGALTCEGGVYRVK